jgi:hypothetical protein
MIFRSFWFRNNKAIDALNERMPDMLGKLSPREQFLLDILGNLSPRERIVSHNLEKLFHSRKATDNLILGVDTVPYSATGELIGKSLNDCALVAS